MRASLTLLLQLKLMMMLMLMTKVMVCISAKVILDVDWQSPDMQPRPPYTTKKQSNVTNRYILYRTRKSRD